MGTRRPLELATASVLAGAGCTHYYKLEVHDVTQLELATVTLEATGPRLGERSLCARGALLEVVATTADGVRHEEGLATRVDKAQFDPRLVALTASVGSFHERAWNPPADPLAMLGQPTVTLTATLVGNPTVHRSLTLTPTWACDPPVAYVGGGDGSGGAFGAAAAAAGKPGAPGGAGQRGADGYASTVSIGWLQRDGERLAVADVMTRGLGESLFVLDQVTALKILANGGNGGGGGTGGFGGATETGAAGPGGKGGDGGDGGDGGAVTVRYDAASPELAALVVVENRGGHGGAHGYAGGGGMTLDAATTSTLGDVGDTGENGRPGRPGPPVVLEAAPNLSAQLTAMVMHGLRAEVALAPPADAPPLEPGHHQSPMLHGAIDGARQYEGDSELDLTLPGRPPIPHRANIHVESTRTSHGHFTIAFGEGVVCKLDFHRPTGGPQLRYVLDVPVVCTSRTLVFDVRTATLTVDPVLDQIHMVADGNGSIAKSNTPLGPVAFHFELTGKRR